MVRGRSVATAVTMFGFRPSAQLVFWPTKISPLGTKGCVAEVEIGDWLIVVVTHDSDDAKNFSK